MSIMIFLMCCVCFASLSDGIAAISQREARKDRRVRWFFLLCMANAVLSFAYANVQDNNSLVSVVRFRYLIVGGVLLAMQFTLHLIIELSENREATVKTLSRLLMVCCVAAILIAADGAHVNLQNRGANTISYVLNDNWASYAESAYVFLVSILALYVLWRRWKTADYKRMKLQAATCAIAMALLTLSTQLVILTPIVGVTLPPLCGIFIYLFIFFIKRMSKRYETYNISFENIAGLIYAEVDMPILVTDAHDAVILANRAARPFFGMDKTDIYGTGIEKLFSSDWPQATASLDSGAGNVTFETTTYDGAHSVLVEKTRHNDDYGELLCSIYMIRDVTESKELIRQLNDTLVEVEIANKAKSSFLANMSHEIRTPMNAIVGMSEIALQHDLPSEISANIQSIRSAGLGLVTIINDILDFSKIESGKMEISENEYIFSSVIVDIVNMFAIKMANSDVLLLVDVNPRIPMYLIGDEIRIKQILVNIIGNAVKFTRKGYVKLEIDGSFDDDVGTYSLLFRVIDTGVGIKEEDLPKLFQMFSQVDTKKNRNIVGTGLGLPIARNLSQMMGGNITVESVYGTGSIFNILIKQKVRRNNAPLTYVENPSDKYVIVYEPDDNLQHSFEQMLANLEVRYEVHSDAAGFESALASGAATHAALRTELLDAGLEKAAVGVQDRTKLILVTNIYARPHAGVQCSEVYLPLYAFQMADILNNRESKIVAKDRGADYSVTPVPDAKVLVVDDTYVNLQVAQGLLAPYGMTVHTASGGLEAIEMVGKNDYDIVFMDHMMPDMDGVEAAHAIRALGGKYAELVIIALTANAIAGAREMFIGEGFNDFLAKPIEMSKLKGIVKKWLVAKYAGRAGPPERGGEAAGSPPASFEQAADDLLDYERGLSFLGGNPQLYFSILKTYRLGLPGKREDLERSLEKGDFKLYAIAAHSVKSTAMSLGVRVVPELAYALEKAGKDGDGDFVATRHGELLEHMVRLEREIARRFGERIGMAADDAESGPVPAEQAVTKDAIDKGLLTELLDAVDFCDSKQSAAVLAEIRKETYPAEAEAFLRRLDAGIEQSDFMGTENMLREYLKEENGDG